MMYLLGEFYYSTNKRVNDWAVGGGSETEGPANMRPVQLTRTPDTPPLLASFHSSLDYSWMPEAATTFPFHASLTCQTTDGSLLLQMNATTVCRNYKVLSTSFSFSTKNRSQQPLSIYTTALLRAMCKQLLLHSCKHHLLFGEWFMVPASSN
jgi:hypothetical protein